MTANPSSAADFCQYSISFNRRFPDYPKLGDTSNLLLIGANAFDRVTGSFLDSDLYSVAKPPPGTTCPAASTLTGDKEFNLKNANGKTAFTPVPANQTDTDTTGYVVACPASIPRKGATFLSLYDVSENPDGTMNASSARNVSVDKYKVPANAPQPGTTNKLDALDARLTQAVSATDPAHGNVAIWTQHTIFGGGAGARVRWYEIDLSNASLFQSGNITGESTSDSKRYVFNGVISPDRAVVSDTGLFGSNMILGFNTSFANQKPDIRMASKVGTNPTEVQSTPIKLFPFALKDFTCSSKFCRWGDYAAATPDPTPPVGTSGQVWLTNQFVEDNGNSGAGWGSWNWAATP